MRAVVRDAYYVFIILSNLLDIKLLEIYRINSKVILSEMFLDDNFCLICVVSLSTLRIGKL